MAVKRARVDPASPILDPSSVRQLGLVLSRFEFNGLANPNYRPGRFSLKVCMYALSECRFSTILWVFKTRSGVQWPGQSQLPPGQVLPKGLHVRTFRVSIQHQFLGFETRLGVQRPDQPQLPPGQVLPEGTPV